MLILRLMRHVAPVALLVMVVASCALAQSRPQPTNQPNGQATDEQNARRDAAIEAITKELSGIREQTARMEQDRLTRDAKPGPPIYSNWVLIVVTSGAVVAAFLTLNTLRKQVDANADAAKAARRNAVAAMRSAKTAHLAFIADQRPWVSLDVDLSGPLAFEVVGSETDAKWRITLAYRLRNVGRTPALGVKFSAAIVPWMLGPNELAEHGQVTQRGSTDPEWLIEELTAPKEDVAAVMLKFGARILFPNEEDLGEYPVTIEPVVISRAVDSPHYAGHFILVAGVTYNHQFSDNVHATAKAFHLYRKPWPTGRVDLAGETVPLEELALGPYPVHADKAT